MTYRPPVKKSTFDGPSGLAKVALNKAVNYADLTHLLGMEIILSEDCVHPHLAWMPQAQRVSAG